MTREGLCRGDSNLRTDVDVCSCIRSTGDAGADGVTDAVDECSLLLSQLDGGQSVGRLTTLRYGNHHIILRHYRVTIAKLRGVLNFAGNAAQTLEKLLADKSGMPRCATGYNHDALGTQQLLAVVNHGRKRHVVTLHIDTTSHTVVQTVRLLENLLQHEVVIAAFLYLAKIDVYRAYLQLLLLT